MGMDVYGRNPESEVGRHFRVTIWAWHPLADYVVEVGQKAGIAVDGCKYWHSNDGDGLDAKTMCMLADALKREVKAGRTSEYVGELHRMLRELPDEDCSICEGTGQTLLDLEVGGSVEEPCSKCCSTGKTRPIDTWDYLDVSMVVRFANFLEHSGGFEIH